MLKYSQTLNYIVKFLYDFAMEFPDKYLSLPEILNILNYRSSFGEAVEIAEYLETKGYVTTIYTIGDILIQITPIGKLNIENIGGGFDNEYGEYIATLEGKPLEIYISPKNPNPKAKVISLVDNIKDDFVEKLGSEIDVVKDLEIIKMELSKILPDFRVVQLKLDENSHHEYALEKIRELRNYIAHAQ